jgi:hypothetical protein
MLFMGWQNPLDGRCCGDIRRLVVSDDLHTLTLAVETSFHQATFRDDEHWRFHGLAVPFAPGVAQVFSRPVVFANNAGGYDMWFSYLSGTGQKYRIGYASSDDGVSWRLRLDEVGIDVSHEGWDSDMIEYPYVLDHKGVRYMLYNGNGYGASGFGVAICEN